MGCGDVEDEDWQNGLHNTSIKHENAAVCMHMYRKAVSMAEAVKWAADASKSPHVPDAIRQ